MQFLYLFCSVFSSVWWFLLFSCLCDYLMCVTCALMTCVFQPCPFSLCLPVCLCCPRLLCLSPVSDQFVLWLWISPCFMDFVLLPSSIEPLQTRLICLCGESTETSPISWNHSECVFRLWTWTLPQLNCDILKPVFNSISRRPVKMNLTEQAQFTCRKVFNGIFVLNWSQILSLLWWKSAHMKPACTQETWVCPGMFPTFTHILSSLVILKYSDDFCPTAAAVIWSSGSLQDIW